MVPVDPLWIQHVTGGAKGYPDVFMNAYSGYWAFGAAHHPDHGWLAFEHGGERERPTVEEIERVKAIWLAGEPLPEYWIRFDRAAAIAAWAVGVERYGRDWFKRGDGPRYDCVLQIGVGVTWVKSPTEIEARYG